MNNRLEGFTENELLVLEMGQNQVQRYLQGMLEYEVGLSECTKRYIYDDLELIINIRKELNDDIKRRREEKFKNIKVIVED